MVALENTPCMNFNSAGIRDDHLHVGVSTCRGKNTSSCKERKLKPLVIINGSPTQIYINNWLKPAPRIARHHLF